MCVYVFMRPYVHACVNGCGLILQWGSGTASLGVVTCQRNIWELKIAESTVNLCVDIYHLAYILKPLRKSNKNPFWNISKNPYTNDAESSKRQQKYKHTFSKTMHLIAN